MSKRGLRLLVPCALAAVCLLTSAAAQARTSVTLQLTVDFGVNSQITVTLPAGTPAGTTSGAPTVIPAGIYEIILTGPGGCTWVPYWLFSGPGQLIRDNLGQGEDWFMEYIITLQPNSTYIWSNSDFPNVVHTIKTSGDVLGTAPTKVAWTGAISKKKGGNKDIVGTNVVVLRGGLSGTVTAKGEPALSFKGKTASKLLHGRYIVSVDDQSAAGGFSIIKTNHSMVTVTGVPFKGKRSVSLTLTKGTWYITSHKGAKRYPIVVR